MKKIILLFIKFYQRTISLDHGFLSKLFPYGYCRYKPTCSNYTYQAVEKYGVIKGITIGIWRILRCNPLSKGGWDPVK
ncbi:membrane protein insertion efficiency factor YidD [Candidatus Berkelbacteria bacterium RIFCSPHIGHO2_12_FULL_36_9]|uniref:Putative membrane protein insertion efficiency factor n=1 Tax=Candidatus Berkelbacteria bacterium RIFCSPHIGHO2_12_FULL_36_9 TaxID=1797469 RepID=A0A1F5EFR1_9BACT|nr:MAG: membrane protein insertion efficiency factor YidD [Candidatus Berkelbacteria bacterium RIFCSPHIGHO2_12_FULL_36_9]